MGPLFLWPGLSNPTSDLIQTTMDAWRSYNASYCGASAGQWCVEASVFGSFGQRNGPAVAIDPDDHVTIEYKLGSDNNTWTQTVTSQKLGKVVSTLTSTSGLMYGGGFGFATEADANSYTIDTQYYLCTEIHLDAADPTFGATGVGGIGAKMGATGTGSGIGTIKNLHTPDNGLTWLADLITLPAMNPQGTQTPAPAYSCTTSGRRHGGRWQHRQRWQRRKGGSTGSGGNAGSSGKGGNAAAAPAAAAAPGRAAAPAAAATPAAVAAPAALAEGGRLWQRRQRRLRRHDGSGGAAAAGTTGTRWRGMRHDGHRRPQWHRWCQPRLWRQHRWPELAARSGSGTGGATGTGETGGSAGADGRRLGL